MAVVAAPVGVPARPHVHPEQLPPGGGPAMPAVKPGPKRVLGNSTAACGGCCILSEGWWSSCFIAPLVVGVTVVFCTSVSPNAPLTILVAVSGCLAALSLFLAVAMDPGVLIPSNTPPAFVPYSNGMTISLPQPGHATVVGTAGPGTEVKVCSTCHISRPEGSSHCKWCDFCVDDYDHHCGVVGSCVARRTFRFFTWFFIWTTVLAGCAFVGSIMRLTSMSKEEMQDGTDWEKWQTAASVVCCLVAAFGGCYATPMALSYIFMACNGTTAKVVARQERENRVHYEPSLCKCICRLCGPIPRSRLKPEHYV